MAKLDIEIKGYNDALNTMSINGKIAKIKQDKNGSRYCSVELNSNVADVEICKYHHYVGKAWFIWNLLYYIISVFGLFDVRFNKRFLVIDCRLKLTVENDEKLTLSILNFEDGGKFAEIETNLNIEEKSNVQYFDEQARQRHKTMKKAKIGIFIAAVILAIVLITVL